MDEIERWVAPLRAAEQRLAGECMSPAASRRVARRIAADERERRRWWRPYIPAISFAAGATLVLLVFAVQHGRAIVEPAPRASQSELDRTAAPPAAVVVPPPPAELPVCAPGPSAVCPAASVAPSQGAAAVPLVTPRARGGARPQPDAQSRAPVIVPPPPGPPAQDDRIDALLRELRALRRAGRYAEAATRLEQALLESWPARTREVLHYELGTILDAHLDAGERACAHWQEHLARFPRTRYARAVADARQRRGCL